MKPRIVVSAVVAAASLAAAPAYAGEYQPFQTDFPSSPQVQQHFIPGVTDFPSGGPTVPTTTLTADDGIEVERRRPPRRRQAALGLGLAGSALLIRRRSTLAHT
jgi:hypothetical protein